MNKTLVLLIVVCFLHASCKEKITQVSPPDILAITQLKAIDTSLFRSYAADIQAIRNVEIRNSVAGFLKKIYVDEGQLVKKGQLLFQIEHKQSYTNITAPFNGMINLIPFKAGSLLNEGDLLTTASDVSAVYCYFKIPEIEYLNFLKTKRTLNGESNIYLLLSNGTAYGYPGKMEMVAHEFDENDGSIMFQARFPNDDLVLHHGTTGIIQLPMNIDSSLLLPQKSVFKIQDKNYVFVVGKDNVLKMVSFEPQMGFLTFFLVKSGLRAGDRILYDGAQDVKEGMKIRPLFISMDSLLSRSI